MIAPIVAASLSIAGGGSAAPLSTPTAYPIEPRPLRKLVAEAEIIVTAHVKAPPSDAPRPDRSFPETDEPIAGTTIPNGVRPELVLLEIDQVLKGDPGARTIEQVNYMMICPAPARYVVGTRVLAFLDRTKSGDFTTHALSYGAKTLEEAELAVYVERVKEQLAISGIPDIQRRRRAQVEWLVRCSVDPVTRWEGAHDLAPRGDFMSEYGDPKDDERFASDLTDTQRVALRDALLSSTSFDSGEQCLEELLLPDRDPRVLAWLVDRLRECARDVERDRHGTVSMLVERIGRRDDRAQVKDLARRFTAIQHFSGLHQNDPLSGPARVKALKELLALY